MIYVDTCFIIALTSESDCHHQKAKKLLADAANQQKKVVTAESVFIKEFIVKRLDNVNFNTMTKEEKQKGLKEAREIIYELFSKDILPLQENRTVCFTYQDIVVECNLSSKDIKEKHQDISHFAHCLTYNCSQFITFDNEFIKFLTQRGFNFKLRNLDIITDISKIHAPRLNPEIQIPLPLHEQEELIDLKSH